MPDWEQINWKLETFEMMIKAGIPQHIESFL